MTWSHQRKQFVQCVVNHMYTQLNYPVHISSVIVYQRVLACKPSCPFCRTAVPRDFVIKPKVVEPKDLEKAVSEKLDNKPQWYYEGTQRRLGGFTTPEHLRKLKMLIKTRKTKCIVQVAGFDLYHRLCQYGTIQTGPTRKKKKDTP